jgi:hypothetical protein
MKWRLAPGDTVDDITTVLNNIIQRCHDDRNHNAEHDFEEMVLSFLGSARNQGSAIWIHEPGKAAEDTHQTSSDTHATCNYDSYMDVAIDVSIPP